MFQPTIIIYSNFTLFSFCHGEINGSFDFASRGFQKFTFSFELHRLWAVWKQIKTKLWKKSYPQYRFDNHIEQPIKCSYIFEWRNILYETNKEFIMFVNETFKSTILWMLAETFMHISLLDRDDMWQETKKNIWEICLCCLSNWAEPIKKIRENDTYDICEENGSHSHSHHWRWKEKLEKRFEFDSLRKVIKLLLWW